MKSLTLVAATVLSVIASVSAHGSNTDQMVCQGNNDVCTTGPQSNTPTVSPTVPVSVTPSKRTIMDLFRGAAVKREAATVQQIAAQVASHSLDPTIHAAAVAAGWKPPHKRDLGIVKRGTAAAPSGGNVSPAAAAAHVQAGKPIPDAIHKAAIAAGWTPPGGQKGANSGAAGKKTKAAKRDGIYAREAALNHKQIHSLLRHMEHNPEAEDFIMNAINSDPNIEEFTEKLAGKWLKAREVIPVPYLAERDAEATANRAAEAYSKQSMQRRDAYPEADADAENYFEERDAYPEAAFDIEERDAYPDAAPESWLYDYDF
ncbi:hypothetical protein MMC11_004250 [Xylographa trunciseda]|nr:hypothetical protein [Xylographa trunciseda]